MLLPVNAFKLQGKSDTHGDVVTETLQLKHSLKMKTSKLKTFTVWPFAEKVCEPHDTEDAKSVMSALDQTSVRRTVPTTVSKIPSSREHDQQLQSLTIFRVTEKSQNYSKINILQIMFSDCNSIKMHF